MTDFPRRLRRLRKSRNINQARLAKMLGYGYTAIANYESGRNEPSLGDLCRIAISSMSVWIISLEGLKICIAIKTLNCINA